MQAEYGPVNAATNHELYPLTDLSFLRKGEQFPPPCEKPRLNRYNVNRQLWKGNHKMLIHDDLYNIFPVDQAAELVDKLELVFNWHKRLSTLWADLMLSETPRFLDGTDTEDTAKQGSNKPGESEAEDHAGPTTDPEKELRQEHIDRIVGKDDNAYVNTLYKCAIDRSRYGDGVLKIVLAEDGAQFFAQPPSYWFPVVDPNNLNLYTHHVLAWTFRRTDMTFLRVEIHEPQIIHHHVYRLEGNFIGDEVPIASFDERVPTGIEFTSIDDFLIVPFQGLVPSDEIYGVDDYGDVDSIVYALEQRASQINRILRVHSDPSMYGPEEALETDEDGNTYFKAGDRYFPVEPDQEPPGYVVWDAQMDSQFLEIDMLLKQLYVISETSPAAFGQLESGLAESGSALRRLMQAPLAKVARIAMTFDPAAKRAIKIAAALERENGRDTPEIPQVNIQWQDGLPKDPREAAETEQIRLASGNTSLSSSIMRVDGSTKEEALAEMDRIEEEALATQERELEAAERNAEIQAKHAPDKPPKVAPPTS